MCNEWSSSFKYGMNPFISVVSVQQIYVETHHPSGIIGTMSGKKDGAHKFKGMHGCRDQHHLSDNHDQVANTRAPDLCKLFRT